MSLEFSQSIGRNIRRLRLAQELSQKDIADYLGVSFQQIQKYEKGKNRLPIESLCTLRGLFGVPYECFFEGVSEIDKKRSDAVDRNTVLCAIELQRCKDASKKEKAYQILKILLN